MPTLDSVDPSILYVMMKGEPGLRKSTQALSFPGPQYWFSWDRKMNGISLPAQKWGIDPKTITFDDYEDWTKPRIKLEALQMNCPYKTLVFDSLTSMADMTLRQTLKSKIGASRKSGAQAGKQIAGININEIEDYNAETAAFNELIALTKDINSYHKVNIILIAHVMEVTNQNLSGGTTTVRSIVTAGKRVAAKIPAYCTEVYHFNLEKGAEVGTGDYALETETNGDDFARTSIGLPKKIVFKDQPLYSTWIEPAIKKLKESK
jgi:hypothetical protein